jgi:hypothetical protein
MSGKEVKGEEAGLGLDRRLEAIVPDGKIGVLDLFREGKLGGDHAIGKAGREAAGIHETAALGPGGAGDDDDFVEMGLCGGFKQKGNIDGQPGVAGLITDALGKAEPGAADGGVKDGLERPPPGGISEDNGAKSRTLQDPRGIENAGAEFIANGGQDGGVGLGQAPGAGIGIKDLERGLESSKTTREESLACGNPTRDSQNWHAE